MTSSFRRPLGLLTAVALPASLVALVPASAASADLVPQQLPVTQDWSVPGMITEDDDWSGVDGVIGYRGDGLASTGTDPRTVLADGSATPVDVIEGSTAGSGTGGVHEVEAAGTVALQGSGTAEAPHLVLTAVTTGAEAVSVSYLLRELDASDAEQAVALHYRTGTSGDWTDVPAAFVADASDGDAASTRVAVTLPADAADQPVLQLRVLTTDAGGADSMIGVDDIRVTAGGEPDPDPDPTPDPTPDPDPTPTPDPAEQVLVSEVQGAGSTSPLDGERVAVEAVVTSLFTSRDELDGFFVQEEDADADDSAETSEGVFVFCRGTCPDQLAVGDLVRVAGEVDEYFGMTQVVTADGSIETVSGDNPLPAATTVQLPADGPTDAEATFEAVEGMVVTIPTTLAVSEYFQHARFGLLVLTAQQRPYQYTHVSEPSVEGYEEYLADLSTRRIILDDDNNDNNDAISGGTDEPYPYPEGGLSLDNRFRGGDTITDLTGVMHWSFSGASGTDAWRIRPVPSEDYTFQTANPAPTSAPKVGGTLQVASFNVLNYFTSIDDGGDDCGPTGGAECRGADSAAELERQRAKIVAALAEMDADVVGLIEIQNDDDASVADLVAALNEATQAGTYAYIATGTIGTDAIKQALVYQPAAVTPVGDFAVLDSAEDERFVDTANRPTLVQTFEEVGTGERFTVAVNHLKSKGSACDDLGDPDLGDGQANCNLTRTAAAEALADFLADDPTGSGDGDFLVIGDLNAYRMEDPITALEDAGYTDLLETFAGKDAYTYVFDGQLGYLDHALANKRLLDQVTGAAAWHINADEDPLFDYNDTVQDPSEASFERKSTAEELYAPDPRRSSDHDPVLVGLDLGSQEPAQGLLRLTLLHNNDGESALLPSDSIGGVARFGTIVERLRAEAAAEPGLSGSLLVSSGDNYLAGPQLQASLQNWDGDTDYSDDGPFYDARAMDLLGYDASAVGNHEFDFGPDVLGYFMSEFEDSDIRFVSANLDVTGEEALEQFVATPPGEPGTLVEWTTTEVEGRSVAVVGATTPRLASISSPGPDVQARDDVRAAVQTAIDEATAGGSDIVVLISHLQNIAEDQALIGTLSGLDVAVAGGGDELLANPDDALLAGSDADDVFGPYPLLATGADGAEVPIVTTQGSYGYVGRLIVDIDGSGDVVAVDDRSGPVRNPFDADTPPVDQAEPDPVLLEQVEQPVAAYVAALGDEVIARTEVQLNGVTADVRSRETNLGSLFADALVDTAEDLAPELGAERPVVGLTNSGGIRNSVVLGPDEDITTLDTFTIAPFSNFVAYTTELAPETLVQVLERAVSAATLPTGGLGAEGRFAQVSGMVVTYDPSRTAQVVERADDGTVEVTTEGERVRQLVLTRGDADPANDVVVVRNGEIVEGAPSVDLVSNSFSIANGDNYPFNLGQDGFTNLPVSYQQALADYLAALGTVTAEQYPVGGAGRIVVDGTDVTEPEPANTAPVADAGGPYEVRVGRVIRLDASGSTDADGDELDYAWDLDADGQFDDASVADPEFAGRGRGPGSYEVAVEVSDGDLTSTDTAVVEVVTPGRGPKR